MTPTQIQLVQKTWARVLPIQREAGNVFYDRLFALDPASAGCSSATSPPRARC
jgi:methyl-accepting chemotaxis protein